MSHPVITAEGLSGVELKKSTTLSNQAHGAMSLGGMRHILALDGVRGLAVFMVLAQHCFFVASESPWKVLGEMAQTGWVGVDLFFVLSGFLITGILLRTKEHRSYFRNFIARRALRIFPLYYTTLFVFLVLLPIVFNSLRPGSHDAQRFSELRQDQAWYWLYISNWLFVRLDGWPNCGHLGHTWSLAIEEQFYVFWPLVVWLCSRRALVAACFLGIAAGPAFRSYYVMSGTSWVPPYVATHARIDVLLLGALIAVISQSEKWRSVNWKAWMALAAAGAGILAALHYSLEALNPSVMSGTWYRHSATGSTCAAFIAAASSCPPDSLLARALTWSPLVWLGEYSYGIYIIHWPVFQLLRRVPFSGCPAVLEPWAFFAACVGLSAACAWLSMTVLERPMLRLKRHFS